MHTRSLRLALLTSLGLVPFGCSRALGDNDGPQLHTADASAGLGGASSRLDGGAGGSSPGQLAPCGESTPVAAEDLSVAVSGRSLALTPGIVTGLERCDNGVLHRPASVTCSSALPRPMPPTTDAGSDAATVSQVEYLYREKSRYWLVDSPSCQSDADCTERSHGYCAAAYESTGGLIRAYAVQCFYGCVQDSDCGDGFLCECGDPAGSCVPATCRSDADCGGDRLCAQWLEWDACYDHQRYSCQAPGDECNTPRDCTDGDYCSGEGGQRSCVDTGLSACGRPFLVAGVERVAALRSGSDWGGSEAAERLPLLDALPPAARALAARHWARNGLMEHASVAAFARFTLQLMHLGAPFELIEQSQHAMLDETAHARACFALAARYLGESVQPGPLALDAALDEHELETIVRLAFREGCVGETVATLDAREALDQALALDVRAALERIAADEQRHAELAWRFVRWALEQNPRLRPLLEHEAARLDAELQVPLRALDDIAVPEHGVLSERQREHLRRAALVEVVQPCLRRLLAEDDIRRGDVTPRATAACA